MTADDPQYILIPLTPYDTVSSEVVALGMNNEGEIVGLTKEDDEGEYKAFVWLPFENYSTPVSPGSHYLDSLTSFSNQGDDEGEGTIALDINDAGVAVGAYESGTGRIAMFWDIEAEGFDDDTLDSYLYAFSINDDDDAKIVGGTGPIYGYTIPPEVYPNTYYNGFYYEIDGTLTALNVQSRQGIAFGLSDTIGTDPRLAGMLGCSPNPECNGGNCGIEFDGAYWDNPDNDAVSPDELGAEIPNTETLFVIGLAVNDDADPVVAGMGDADNSNPCRYRGAVWRTGPDDEPDLLPLIPDASTTDSEIALDIRDTYDTNKLEVVGRDVGSNKGAIWRYDSGWTAIDVNEAGVVHWTFDYDQIIAATAINNNGWIAVWGENAVDDIRSAILVPYEEYTTEICPGDIANPDTMHAEGIVNVHDLFALLANWNTDGLGADLAAPTNIVDVADLFVLCANWNCRFGNPYQAQTLEQEVTGAGLTMDDWDDFVYVMQYSEDEDEKANYKCWMMNYLSGCSVCPPCIGNDPYSPRD